MSSRLPSTAVEIDVSLSDAIPTASRLSATNSFASATTALRSSAACADRVGIVGQQPGHRGEVAVELPEQVRAVLQRGHQRRQVLQRGEDVVAVVAECRKCLRHRHDRLADVGALSAQVVGRGVDD